MICGLIVNKGGTASPGCSPGTQTVNGKVVLAAGSTSIVNGTRTAHDLIVATSSARLPGGAVQVLAESGCTKPLATSTILTAGGGVTGTFAEVTANYALLMPVLSYAPDDV